MSLKRNAIRFLLAGAVLSVLTSAFAQTQIERGIGPYTLVTSRGEIGARLLRREGDMIWVDRQVQSGQWIETGIPRSEIIEFKSPRAPEFINAERAETPEQIATSIDELRRLAARLRPYRDLPGIAADEALLMNARLNEQRGFWRDAYLTYEEILGQTYPIAGRQRIRYQAGICLRQMDQKEKALTYLLENPIPEDDLALWSSVTYARAECFAATKRHREAIDAYLSMVVFHPFVQSNEVRALSGLVTNYIALNDWDAVTKTLEALQSDYPAAPETAAVQEMLAAYQQQLAEEKEFQIETE